MTYVSARRFGDRIIMIADTKITNEAGILRSGHGQIHDYLPGRLKAFPLSLNISIGYAGLSDRALTAIRGLVSCPDTGDSLRVVLENLRADSSDGHTDYIVASHVNGPEIFKVWDGAIAPAQDAHWIGDSAVAALHAAAIDERRSREQEVHLWSAQNKFIAAEFGSDEEHRFTGAWTDLLLSSPTLLDTVGGLPVSLLCSPYGHCFNNIAGAYNPETIVFGSDGTITDLDGRSSVPLYGQYSFSFADGGTRGAPVFGVWLQENSTGYLYDPLKFDQPARHSPLDFKSFVEVVRARSKERGGVVIN